MYIWQYNERNTLTSRHEIMQMPLNQSIDKFLISWNVVINESPGVVEADARNSEIGVSEFEI